MRVFVSVVVVVMMAIGVASLSATTFSDDIEIKAGDNYSLVQFESVMPFELIDVTMTGGYVGTMQTENAETFNLSGGKIDDLWVENTTTTISGGEIATMTVRGPWATLTVTGGQVGTGNAFGNNGIYFAGDAVGHLKGGTIPSLMFWTDPKHEYSGTGTAHIYGYNFSFTPNAYSRSGMFGTTWYDLLTGNWEDGSEFSIELQGGYSGTYSHLTFHEVPEPSTLGLFLLGSLAYRRYRLR